MPSVGIKLAIPASERLQIHALDRAALGSAKQHNNLKESMMGYFENCQNVIVILHDDTV
jgi:hypothetical protein